MTKNYLNAWLLSVVLLLSCVLAAPGEVAAASCTYTLSKTTVGFDSGPARARVNIRASDAACDWTATASDSWITLMEGASGRGGDVVFYSVSANTGSASRTGTLTIGGQVLTITQGGTATTSCTYTFSQTTPTFDSQAATSSVDVTPSDSACGGWTATTTDSWITLTGNTSGTGNGSITYSVAANTESTSRTGTLTVADSTLTITQSGFTGTYNLTIRSPNDGYVRVSDSTLATDVSCGSSAAFHRCSYTYPAGTSLTLTAYPDPDYSVDSWGGA